MFEMSEVERIALSVIRDPEQTASMLVAFAGYKIGFFSLKKIGSWAYKAGSKFISVFRYEPSELAADCFMALNDTENPPEIRKDKDGKKDKLDILDTFTFSFRVFDGNVSVWDYDGQDVTGMLTAKDLVHIGDRVEEVKYSIKKKAKEDAYNALLMKVRRKSSV
jgi:hypothetical protein